jgi:hypothetical protein
MAFYPFMGSLPGNEHVVDRDEYRRVPVLTLELENPEVKPA